MHVCIFLYFEKNRIVFSLSVQILDDDIIIESLRSFILAWKIIFKVYQSDIWRPDFHSLTLECTHIARCYFFNHFSHANVLVLSARSFEPISHEFINKECNPKTEKNIDIDLRFSVFWSKQRGPKGQRRRSQVGEFSMKQRSRFIRRWMNTIESRQ